MLTIPVRITVNGIVRQHDVEPRLLLVHFLRDTCGLTGTHVGCETSICGACTVLVDGEAVKSCTMFAAQADGSEITTIEGLAPREESESSSAAARASGGGAPRANNHDVLLHPVQQGFWECHGAQCGFCTPGMIMSAVQLLERNPSPSREEIAHALRGNLCRCTGYTHIIDAVEHASGAGRPVMARRASGSERAAGAERADEAARERRRAGSGGEAPGSKLVGRAMKRVEDPRLIRGAATYTDDVRLPGLLHVAIARSPYAHARVLKIDTSAARAMDRVVGVFTGADINPSVGPVPCGSPMPDMKAPRHTVLAGDRVYFVGHPVAAVVASCPYVARDAVEALEIEYDPLPVVTDPEAALAKGAALTHPELGTNVCYTHVLTGGDIDEAFRQADRVIKQRVVHQRLTPMPIEPRGVVASYHSGEGSLTIWTSSQVPHLVRTLLPDMLSIAENKLRIIAPEVGGGFGAKLNVYAEEALCGYLAMHLNAPVKWIESRRDNAAATTHGRDQIGEYEVAVKNDGTILGIKARSVADLGAYLQLNTPAIPTLTGIVLSGCYKIPAVRMDLVAVLTHKMATDAYRGAGRPEATYLIERLMDLVANELGLDRLEIRRKHFPAPSEFPYNTICGLTYDSGNYAGALDKAQQLAGWDALMAERASARTAGRLFGVGVSTYVEICAMGPSKAMSVGGWEWGSVRLDMSGAVTVVTGATPHGQGQETSFTQIVADRLGVPPEDIVVLHGDTAVALYGRDTYGSRATAVGGTAIVMCVDKIVAKAKTLAAHLLDVAPADVQFADGRFSAKGKDRTLDWKTLANEAYVAKNLPSGFEPGLEASSFFEPSNFTFPFGTHIVAVEVDRDTGAVTFKKYVAVDDCGPQINPLLVEGQVQGGIAQALGQVMMERTVYDEHGQLLTGEFMDYAIPRAHDIPEYILGSTETPSPSNPLGIKGVGEAGTIGATPAIVNAVMDALAPLGIKHVDLPLTPDKLWKAMASAEGERVKG